MKHLLLAVLLSTLAMSCTLPEDKSANYEDARRSTIEAWEEVVGRVSDECYERSVDAMVIETGRFPQSCMPPLELGRTYVGCYLPTKELGGGIEAVISNLETNVGDIIYLYEGRTERQKLDTAVHEYVHLLHFCEFSVGKPLDLDLLFGCAAQIAENGEPGSNCEMPGDYFHLDDRMWDRIQIEENGYGTRTVEAVGCANLEL